MYFSWIYGEGKDREMSCGKAIAVGLKKVAEAGMGQGRRPDSSIGFKLGWRTAVKATELLLPFSWSPDMNRLLCVIGHLTSIFSKSSVSRMNVYENFLPEIPIQAVTILNTRCRISAIRIYDLIVLLCMLQKKKPNSPTVGKQTLTVVLLNIF